MPALCPYTVRWVINRRSAVVGSLPSGHLVTAIEEPVGQLLTDWFWISWQINVFYISCTLGPLMDLDRCSPSQGKDEAGTFG